MASHASINMSSVKKWKIVSIVITADQSTAVEYIFIANQHFTLVIWLFKKITHQFRWKFPMGKTLLNETESSIHQKVLKRVYTHQSTESYTESLWSGSVFISFLKFSRRCVSALVLFLIFTSVWVVYWENSFNFSHQHLFKKLMKIDENLYFHPVFQGWKKIQKSFAQRISYKMKQKLPDLSMRNLRPLKTTTTWIFSKTEKYFFPLNLHNPHHSYRKKETIS